MKNLLLTLVISAILPQCKSEEERKLVWSDEFNNPGQPDSSRWNYDLGDGCPNVCGWGNNELEYYTKDSKNVRVANDMLTIRVEVYAFPPSES